MFKIALVSTLLALAAAKPRLDGRIVGGEDVNIEQYPYQLSLQYYGGHICGASVISERFAVTAAHCTLGSVPADLSVRAGSSFTDSAGTVIQVKKIMTNPNYDPYTIDNDITVLELAEALPLGSTIRPISLPSYGENVPAGSSAVVSGFGVTSENGPSSYQLQAVRVNIVGAEECKKAYGQSAITERMICAGVNGGGKDACQGDSGGPLVVDGKLVGIVSWGYGCARPDYPGVYGSVPAMRDFISQNAGI